MSKNRHQVKPIKGTIRMHFRGFGFVIPNDPRDSDQDIFIPKHLTKHAIDGDCVEVIIHALSKSKKGPEGEIVSITKRSKTHLAGTIESVSKGGVSAHIPLLSRQQPAVIKPGKIGKLKPGDRCLFKVEKWGKGAQSALLTPFRTIGHIDDPSYDVQAALCEHGLESAFPPKALKEAQGFGKAVFKHAFKGRLDLTQHPCFTIDPDTAKDFDDALFIDKTNAGYLLGVHIADVAHYVKKGSALDHAAKARSNSTYFPEKCIPMLPKDLSNNLCSLRQGVNRLTVSVLMQFDQQGNLQTSTIERSVIKSAKRFTYDEALSVLEGKKKSPHQDAIRHMEQLCQLLKQKRSERGSIDFSIAELVVVVDQHGVPTGTKVEPYHITHQLVEEFMLKANEVVATHLAQRGVKQLFRIHEEPDTENLEDFCSMARMLGFHVPATPSQQDLQNLFDRAKNTPFSHQLAIGFIRNLKLAYYSPRNVGHYGLALKHYCHFTSPIRRYSDLITQRLLFGEELSEMQLEAIGKHCSEKERISFKAEMGVKLLKKLRLLKAWMGDDPGRSYTATITKIKPFGLYFEVDALNLEGFLHIADLENDYFIYREQVPMLQGERSGMQHKIGNTIEIKPTHIDLIHLEATWELLMDARLRRRKHRKKHPPR